MASGQRRAGPRHTPDGLVCLWDTSGHQQLDELPSGPTKGVALSPDGRFLATAGYDGPVTLWDLSGHR